MKVAVWGAGQVGRPLAYRLVTCDFVSSLVWINRCYKRIASRVVDLEHGLAFAPCCNSVVGVPGEYAHEELDDVEVVILTQGSAVKEGGTRAELLDKNADALQSAAIALRDFAGVVFVVTNPVDAMARFIHETSGLPASRVIGLGTVVETARLRAAIAGNVIPSVPPRSIWSFAIGTHDENTRIVAGPLGVGLPDLSTGVWEAIRREVVAGPARVRQDHLATIHPVVEGAAAVIGAIARDSGDVYTVSVRDQQSGSYFSVPVSVGRLGVIDRHIKGISREDMEACRAAAERVQSDLPR